MNILIRNIDTITSDKSNMFIKNTNIGIENGIIKFVSNNEKDLNNFKADRIISGYNRLAMPGLVNAHTHSPMTLLRNYADDLALEDWLFNHIFPVESKLKENDVYFGTMLGICEMIKSGTTSFCDMYYMVEQSARAVKETGLRANITKSAYSFTFENGSPIFHDDTKAFEVFHNEWNNSSNGRIKTYVNVHSPYIYDAKSMKDSADFAKAMNTGINIHVLETLKERNDTIVKYGENSAYACNEAGIFDVPCIAAHSVHMSDDDIAIFKDKNVNVAHNPTSNLKLGSGIARIPKMQDAGINIALGTDGTASNNNLNMFEELNLVSIIHKGVHQDPLLVSAEDSILMATRNGANAIGFGDEVGVIKAGMKADIILLDTDKIHYTPMNNPISAIAYSSQASDVDTVIVDGVILMEKRELKTIDEELIKFKIKEIIKNIY